MQWNEATGTPHRAYGQAIPIPGYSLITAENAESASRAFLENNAAALGINPRELKLAVARQVQGKWYVSFAHTPVEDTQDTLNTYPVTFCLEGFGISDSDPDSLYVHYSLDNFQTVFSVQAAQLVTYEYQALIPPQAKGSIIEYFITALDPLGNVSLRFPLNGEYGFLVGFNRALLDELEVESGWVIGAPDDNATTGIWERADPVATSLGSQPDDDHTVNGVFSFVTDGRK